MMITQRKHGNKSDFDETKHCHRERSIRDREARNPHCQDAVTQKLPGPDLLTNTLRADRLNQHVK